MKIDLVYLSDQYVELLRQWRNANRSAFIDSREISKADQAIWWTKHKQTQGDDQYVIVADGEPVGSIAVINGDPIEIARVMLGRKDLARRGIMKAAINQAIGRYPGKVGVFLRVKVDTAPAIGLYRRCGFLVYSVSEGIMEMRRGEGTLLGRAAQRMGFDTTALYGVDRLYFDECALMSRPPPRKAVVALLGRDVVVEGIYGAFGTTSIERVLAATDLRACEVAVGRLNTVEAQARALAACASGCLFVAVDDGHLPYLDATRDYVRAPLRGLGVTGVKDAPEYTYADPEIAAALAGGLVGKVVTRVAAEHTRRIVFARAASGRVALDGLKANGAYDAGPFLAHGEKFEAARDMYMFESEREMFYALLSTLKVDGNVLEIGIGNGGTLSVVALFCGEREVHAIDDFSYSKGDNQQRAVTKVLEAGKRINLITAKSQNVNWDQQLAFLHIDGGHDFVDVNDDIRRFAPHVVVGGVMAIDDYMTREDQTGVGEAVDTFMSENMASWIPITCGPKVGFWRRVA